VTTTRPATSQVETSHDHPLRDLRRTWRWIAGAALVLGPLGVTAIRAVMPYWTDDSPAEMVAGFAADPGAGATMNWLSLVVTPFLLLSALAMGFVARRRAPVIATWGAAVLFGAYALGGAVSAPDVLVSALLDRGDDHASVAETAALLMDHPPMLVGALSFVIGHLVGMVLVAIAVVRAKIVPGWVGLVIALAQPVHVVSAVVLPNRMLDVVLGWGATTIGYALVALAVIRTPDDQWDLAPQSR